MQRIHLVASENNIVCVHVLLRDCRFYTALGLFVTKHASAVLSRLATAVILPLTAVVFNLPLMGRYKESINVYTIVGLVVTFIGFGLYQWATEVYRKNHQKRTQEDNTAETLSEQVE